MYKILLGLVCVTFLILCFSWHFPIYADNVATGSAPLLVVTPVDSPTSTLNASNAANITNTANNTCNTGLITIEGTDSSTSATLDATSSETPTPEDQGTQTTTTGDAINTTTVDNTVNTTSTNAQIVYQTVNIFFDQNGTIDLSSPITIAQTVASESAASSTDVLVSSNNYATVNNVIVGSANTGGNASSGNSNLVIDTGNAYSIVSLINKVNLTVVNSTIHIITVNIYGNLTGNIILPQVNSQSTCISCSISVTANTTASVANTVTTTANTGNNSIASSSGTINTGNAESMTNITDILNTFLFQTSFEHLYINTFGTWDGNFLGWDTNPGQAGGQSLDIASVNTANTNSSCSDCTNMVQNINTATVENLVSNTANTGGNTTTGGNGSITTGNAYAFTNIINLINSVFIQTTGFLGFVNIFGSLHGDIGGVNYFVTPTPNPPDTTPDTTDTSQKVEIKDMQITPTVNPSYTYQLPFRKNTFEETNKSSTTSKTKAVLSTFSRQPKHEFWSLYILSSISILLGTLIFRKIFS